MKTWKVSNEVAWTTTGRRHRGHFGLIAISTEMDDTTLFIRHCQSNMKQALQILRRQALCCKLAPLFKRGSSVKFEGLTIGEVAFQVEMVVD